MFGSTITIEELVGFWKIDQFLVISHDGEPREWGQKLRGFIEYREFRNGMAVYLQRDRHAKDGTVLEPLDTILGSVKAESKLPGPSG